MKTRSLPEPSFITNHCCNLVTATPAPLDPSYATAPSPEPPPDHRSTTVNSDQRRSTAAQLLSDHQSTMGQTRLERTTLTNDGPTTGSTGSTFRSYGGDRQSMACHTTWLLTWCRGDNTLKHDSN
ncbi:hypothetical protein Tco_0728141 [Tanacetum coccineum]|uniref:Uncharacterized protein n=1 Tax=Tanacetum coccineum TaxID=301880 RepID=A0ABQ4YL71_9ASTR